MMNDNNNIENNDVNGYKKKSIKLIVEWQFGKKKHKHLMI